MPRGLYIHSVYKPRPTIRLSRGDYTFKDSLGSPVTGTTSAGSISWRERYTPYGEKLLDPAANRDEPGYTGHIQDDATGLTYMQARYDDPVIGRFLSIDPVGFSPDQPFMFNRYAYVGNDPVNLIDPNGKDARAFIEDMFINDVESRKSSQTNVLARRVVDVLGQTPVAATQIASDVIDSLPNQNQVREAAGDTSDTLTLIAAGSAILGQPEVAIPAAIGATVAGFVEAALSPTPGKDILIESVATITGMKSVGTVSKVASELAGNSKKAQDFISGVGELGEEAVSDFMKNDN